MNELALIIVLLSFSIFYVMILLIYRNHEFVMDNKVILTCFLIGLIIITTFTITEYRTERRISIQSLNGKNPYEMKLVYEKQDSTYVVIDTLYIKKE